MYLVADTEPSDTDSPSDTTSSGEGLAWCQTAEGVAELAHRRGLDDRIGVLAAQIHSLEAELAGTVAAFDTAGGWQGGGFRSMGQWLSIRTKFTVPDAQRIARVASKLESVPTLHAEAVAGRVSLGVLDAAARVTTPENEAAVARVGLACTPAQVSKVLSSYRNLKPTNDPDPDTGPDPLPEYWWRTFEDHNGRGRIDAAMDATRMALMAQAWAAATATWDKDREQAGEDPEVPQRPDVNEIAEHLASAMLDQANSSGLRDQGGEKFLVQLHLDVQTLAEILGLDFNSALPFRLGSECFLPDTGRHLSDAEATRFLCEGNIHVLIHTNGEPTTLDNGVFLCGYHHRTLHKTNWNVTLNGDQTYTFHDEQRCLGTTTRRTGPGGPAPDLMQLPGLTPPDIPRTITGDTPKSGTRGEHLTPYALDVYLEKLLTAG